MELPSVFKGSCTELSCAVSFIKEGIEVSFPYGNHARYDFIADIKGNLIKVQVKTSKDYSDYIEFECRRTKYQEGHHSRTTYSSDEIDVFATYYNGQCYIVPANECSITKRLRFNLPSNGQKKGVNMAKDYLLEDYIKSF